jgi:methionyl-tRNA synthetase
MMETFLAQNIWLLVLLGLWTIPWKGVALWKAARSNSKPWFVVLLLVNTIGILEIIYIFCVGKKKKA